jgi:antitoxin component of RelBE/YafQ-DinJ toxin-antitoxin module
MRSTQITARLPEAVVCQIDQMAEATGLGRGQILRLLLTRATEEGLPSGLADHADELKAARGKSR